MGTGLSFLKMAHRRFDHVGFAFREDKTFWAGLTLTRKKANGTEEKGSCPSLGNTSGRRQVFLICLPGTFWACQKEGFPMMANGQGIVALMVLGLLEELERTKQDPPVLEFEAQFSRVHPASPSRMHAGWLWTPNNSTRLIISPIS
jgi:hypothetical protein